MFLSELKGELIKASKEELFLSELIIDINSLEDY